MDGKRDANLQRKPPVLQRGTAGLWQPAGKPLVVAAVHSPESLAAAVALRDAPDAAPDWLELRVDCFAANPGVLEPLAAEPPRPLLLTVRRPDEGGGTAELSDARRAELYARFLPGAAALDVEVRSLAALEATVRKAQGIGIRLVASFHDFQSTPRLETLRELAGQAVDAGADVFKVAALTRGPVDLARLLDFLATEDRIALALMGMGQLGKVSRVVLGAAGSVLNYGYLGDTAQVPGQWPVERLRERIEEAWGGE